MAPASTVVLVRAARAGDAERLVEFNAALASETEGLELDRARLAAGVLAALRDPQRGEYALAELDSAAVGCTLVTRDWSDWRNGWLWWIQSVYVAPAARRRGVYSALHRHVLERARRAGDVGGVRLYVDRDNRAAQATYERLGMERSHYLLYEQAEPPRA
jgi:ribosomal protein S18 acetylase RimI-like enzyme